MITYDFITNEDLNNFRDLGINKVQRSLQIVTVFVNRSIQRKDLCMLVYAAGTIDESKAG